MPLAGVLGLGEGGLQTEPESLPSGLLAGTPQAGARLLDVLLALRPGRPRVAQDAGVPYSVPTQDLRELPSSEMERAAVGDVPPTIEKCWAE